MSWLRLSETAVNAICGREAEIIDTFLIFGNKCFFAKMLLFAKNTFPVKFQIFPEHPVCIHLASKCSNSVENFESSLHS